MVKYVTEAQFGALVKIMESSMKANQATSDKLVDTFNHSVSEIKKDVHEFKEKSGDKLNQMAISFAKMEGSTETSKKLLWILVSFIGAMFGAVILSVLTNP